jgi:hypothetical protein
MNRPNGCDGNLEAATDQLVDEICQRLASLYTLLDASVAEDGPALHEIRAHAGEIVRRLDGPGGRAAATLVARILWTPHSGHQAPDWWWETPLGALIQQASTKHGNHAALGTPG